MTIDEAIEILKDGELNPCVTEDREACDMAIKALEQEPIIDKIRAEVIAKYPKNYAGEPELGGCACEFSLNQILQIIDKYKAEMESKE